MWHNINFTHSIDSVIAKYNITNCIIKKHLATISFNINHLIFISIVFLNTRNFPN